MYGLELFLFMCHIGVAAVGCRTVRRASKNIFQAQVSTQRRRMPLTMFHCPEAVGSMGDRLTQGRAVLSPDTHPMRVALLTQEDSCVCVEAHGHSH